MESTSQSLGKRGHDDHGTEGDDKRQRAYITVKAETNYAVQTEAMSYFAKLERLRTGGGQVPRMLQLAVDIKPDKANKKFMVAKADDFWAKYRRAGAVRCHYEIIDITRPCKLFLDIDVPLENAPADFDGVRQVATVISLTRRLMERLLGILCDDPAVVLYNLESCNHKKFSHHLIFDLGNRRAFKTSADCGAFYRHLERELINLYGPPDQSEFWHWELEHDGSRKYIGNVDPGVYTRYRNFRLHASSKLGQNRYLCLDGTDLDAPRRNTTEGVRMGDDEKATLFGSMIQWFDEAPDVLLEVCEPGGEPAIYTSKPWHREASRSKPKTRAPSDSAWQPQETQRAQQEGCVRHRVGRASEFKLLAPDDLWSRESIPKVAIELGQLFSTAYDTALKEVGLCGDDGRPSVLAYYMWFPDSRRCLFQFQGKTCLLHKKRHKSQHPALNFSISENHKAVGPLEIHCSIYCHSEDEAAPCSIKVALEADSPLATRLALLARSYREMHQTTMLGFFEGIDEERGEEDGV